MKKNKTKASFIKLVPKIVRHALQTGKSGYLILLVISVIISISSYFHLKITEVGTNVTYIFVTNKNSEFLETIKPFIIIVSILFILNIFNRFSNLLKIKVRKNLKFGFDTALTKKLSQMTWENYETHEVSMKIEMVKRDGESAFENLSTYFIWWIIETIIYMIIYILIISRISWWVALSFIGASIIYVYIGLLCGNKIYNTYRSNDKIYKQRTYLFKCNQSKEAHQDSIVNRLYHHLSKRWRKTNDEWMDDSIKMGTKVSIYTIIPNIIFSIIALSLLYLVVKEVENGSQQIGYFTLICTTLINFGSNLQGMTRSASWYEKDLNVYQDYLDLMAVSDDYVNTEEYLGDNFNIEFKNVDYIYPQSTNKALNNLNIKIQNHETIAIVGVNGSGKTTFVNMLMELSKKYSGEVIVNNKNIISDLGVLRNSCSCIFQDFLQYQFTIKENIIIGDLSREISDEEINQILKNVGLFDFVNSLPDKENTMLGQINKGTEISKGQWQRLAVARLLANKQSKIWILDEPTAYLDPIGEIEMYDFIYKLKGDRTVIFISHRLGFSKRAKRIVVFKDGKVIEDSNHQQLIKNENSEYAKMYEKQKKWYE